MPEIWELRLLKYFFILCVAITFYVGTSLPYSATQWLHIETVKQGLTVKHLHFVLLLVLVLYFFFSRMVLVLTHSAFYHQQEW